MDERTEALQELIRDEMDESTHVAVSEQEDDIGRDVSERGDHPLGDSIESDEGYDVDPSRTNHDG